MQDEFKLISWIQKTVPKPPAGFIGIGDDAALLPSSGRGGWVLTTDAIVEEVDFIRGKLSPHAVGRKAMAVNLSDLAAMGAEPVACVITVGIPRRLSASWIKRFYQGLLKLARQHKTLCLGGDISRSGKFFASITLLGRSRTGRGILRKGARHGDVLAVTGRLGGSILKHHHAFTPRIDEGLFLARNFAPHAMMDISDGLAKDLEHLIRASKVGARIDLDLIPVSRDAAKLARSSRQKALIRALTDGEDFELLFAVSKRKWPKLARTWKRRFPRVPMTQIGSIQRGRSVISWFRNGRRDNQFHLQRKGYSHF